jgi:hypothetical protein
MQFTFILFRVSNRSNPLALVLYGDVIIFARNQEQLVMWCLNILAREVDMKDVVVWQVVDGPRLCSFKFTGGQAPKRGDVRDVMIICSNRQVHFH